MYEKRAAEKAGWSRLFPDARYQVATFRSDREVENTNIYTVPGVVAGSHCIFSAELSGGGYIFFCGLE